MRTSRTVGGRTQTRQRVIGFHIGCRLVRRDIKNWTQTELAFMASEVGRRQTGDRSVSVSPTTIALIESANRNPSWEVASWIAEALGYEVADLGIDLESIEASTRNGSVPPAALERLIRTQIREPEAEVAS